MARLPMSLPKRLLFLLRSVCALPNASNTGLDSSTLSCMMHYDIMATWIRGGRASLHSNRHPQGGLPGRMVARNPISRRLHGLAQEGSSDRGQAQAAPPCRCRQPGRPGSA